MKESAEKGPSCEIGRDRRIQPGLALLAQAEADARDTSREVWDFAVEIRYLYALGLTDGDLRWLACKEYARHALETTQFGIAGRRFSTCGLLVFYPSSCFTITPTGIQFSRQCSENPENAVPVGELPRSPSGTETTRDASSGIKPHWDASRRTLTVGKAVVKNFRVPAPNQELILQAFEEDGWPARIDDPLPFTANMEPKNRLHGTIMALNRSRSQSLIRFRGDGTGTGVCWELTVLEVPERRDVASA